MVKDSFMKKFTKIREERNISIEEAAEMLGIRAEALLKYESGVVVPSAEFIEKAESVINMPEKCSDFENSFTQSFFGTKIPLISEQDFVNDNDNHIISYFELPHLNEYGENNLFALKYNGLDIPELGIRKDSFLVFCKCTSIDRDGAYVVVTRGALRFKYAEFQTDGSIRIEPLTGVRSIPKWTKSASARGRLVCCINSYK